MDINLHNKALPMKHVHKFLNQEDIPWVKLIWEAYYSADLTRDKKEGSFWWKAIFNLIPIYKKVATCIFGSGSTTSFWTDKWKLEPLAQLYPELHSFATEKRISLKHFCGPRGLD